MSDFERNHPVRARQLKRYEQRIAELEAKLEINGDHPFPDDFTALDLCVERNKTLLADNKRLRAALRPFAQDDLRLRLGGNSPRDGDSAIIFQRNSAILRLRDFDRAKAALREDEGDENDTSAGES